MAERFLIVILMVAVLLRSSAAATFNVGDALGWTIPPTPSTYSNWASTKTFVVGDILVFDFTNGAHDVTKVTKAAYDSCSGTNPISVVDTSPARITLATAGDHHFICAFPGHCDAGQKLSITVATPSSPPPTATPPTSPPPTATPPSSSPPTSTPPSSPPTTTPPSSPPTTTPASPPSLSPRPRSGPSPSPAAPKAFPPTATPPPENSISPPPTDNIPSTPSPTTSPPPPNAASSLGVVSFSTVVLAIAGALIY